MLSRIDLTCADQQTGGAGLRNSLTVSWLACEGSLWAVMHSYQWAVRVELHTAQLAKASGLAVDAGMFPASLHTVLVLLCVLQLPVRALCFSPDAAYAVSAAVGERLVAVWCSPGPGGKKKAGGVAAASLAVAQPVVQLATAGTTGTAGAQFRGSLQLASAVLV